MSVKIIFVLEFLGAILAHFLRRLGVDQSHVPLHVGLFAGHFTTQSTLVCGLLECGVDKLLKELHDIHVDEICNLVREFELEAL